MFIILVKNRFYSYQFQPLDRKITFVSTSKKRFVMNKLTRWEIWMGKKKRKKRASTQNGSKGPSRGNGKAEKSQLTVGNNQGKAKRTLHTSTHTQLVGPTTHSTLTKARFPCNTQKYPSDTQAILSQYPLIPVHSSPKLRKRTLF
jgi:hypothetical protein